MPQPKPLNPNYRNKGIKRSRADRLAPGMAQEPVINGGTAESNEQDRRYAILAATVNQNIREAVAARENSGIEQIWAEDDDQYNGIDDQSAPNSLVKTRDQVPRAAQRDGRSKVFVPITKPKTDIGVARVSEMLLPNDDRPWDIEPRENPDIDEALQADMSKTETITTADGIQFTIPSAAAAQFVKDMAKKFAQAEADWIEDKFTDGEVYSHLRQVLRDAGRIGTGVIKGPFPVRRVNKKWTIQRSAGQQAQGKLSATPKPAQVATVANPEVSSTIPTQPAGSAPTPGMAAGMPPQNAETSNSVPAPHTSAAPTPGAPQTPVQMAVKAVFKKTETIEPTSVCVRVQDCFPDPSCGDSIHDGAFFAERAFMTGKQLRDLAYLPGYDAQCIVDALKEGPMSYVRMRDNTYRQVTGDTSQDSRLYEVYYYYGDASPEDLELLMSRGNKSPDDAANEPTMEDDDEEEDKSPLKGVLSDEDRRYLSQVPVMVTMLNGKPIRAVLNPMETGGFPYDFFPWEPVKGQPYGRGIPRKMAIAQRILNAAVRALLENAGMSAGPQIVTARGVITPWEGKNEVKGRKGWYFDPDAGIDDIRKAFMVVDIPSAQEQLSAIVQFALDLADQLTNLPMLMQGDQQANTSPETLGGLKMLFNNAMSPLRVLAKLFDDKLIVPHLKRYHDYAMEKGPDKIKGGDSHIVAKGSTALIQREEGREFLAQVFPMKDDPTLRIDPAKLITEMGRSNGFDMSTVQYSDSDWKKLQAAKAQQPPPADPAVQAAQIRTDGLLKVEQARTADADKDRASNERIKMAEFQMREDVQNIAKEIAEMQLSGQSGDTLMQIKAMLAGKAMDNRIKSDDIALKLDPHNKTGTGIAGLGSGVPATPAAVSRPGGAP